MNYIKSYKIFESDHIRQCTNTILEGVHVSKDGKTNIYYDTDYPDKEGQEMLFQYIEPFIDMYDEKWHFSVSIYNENSLNMEITAPGAWDSDNERWVRRYFVPIRELNRTFNIDEACDMIYKMYGFKLTSCIVYGADTGIRINNEYQFKSFSDFLSKFEDQAEIDKNKISGIRMDTNGIRLDFVKE